MIRICPQCRHYRAPVPVVPFGAELNLTPTMIRYEREWIEESARRREEEQRRFEGNLEFHYEPEFFAWCSDRVPSAKKLKEIQAVLEAGDGDTLKEFTKKHRFFADPSRGVVEPIFELCAVRNPKGECDAFKAPDAQDAPPEADKAAP